MWAIIQNIFFFYMKSALFLSLTSVAFFFVSCDEEESLEAKHAKICENLFITDSVPTRVTEPYVILHDYFDFSLIDTTDYLIFRNIYCPVSHSTIQYSGSKASSICIEGLYNHTTYTYQPTIETWDNYYQNVHWYKCKEASFTVDIDEEVIAVTEDMTDSLTDNSVTLSGHFNISPEHAGNYAYFIYTSETPDITIRDGILYNMNGHKLNLDNESNGSVHLSEFLYNKTYYYQACVRYIEDAMSYGATYRGAVKSFTTPPLEVAVTVNEIKDIVPVGPVTLTFEAHCEKDPQRYLSLGICYSATNPEPTCDGADCIINNCYLSNQSEPCESTILGLASGTVYYYRAYAQHPCCTDIYYSDVKTFETEDVNVSPEPTDLGLSVIWAGCNVGATSPEQYGNYYNQGGLGRTSSFAYIDSLKCTDGWRLPTEEECKEIVNRCKSYWINYNGSFGYLVEGKNGAYLFLPASSIDGGEYSTTNGGYWTSTPKYVMKLYKWNLYMAQYTEDTYFSVRLVHDK